MREHSIYKPNKDNPETVTGKFNNPGLGLEAAVLLEMVRVPRCKFFRDLVCGMNVLKNLSLAMGHLNLILSLRDLKIMEVDVYPSFVAETTTCSLPREPLSVSSSEAIMLKTNIALLKKG